MSTSRTPLAIVTGASSGIGAQFAKQLAAKGYDLVLVARRADRLKTMADALPTRAEIHTADLGKAEECVHLVDVMKTRTVDLFINCAGYGDCGAFIDTDLDKELGMIDVNIRAVHILTKRMLQKMQDQGHGSILNVASAAGLMPGGPYMATYYATKAYVTSLTGAIAEELRESGSPVTIAMLCPGPVNTEFNSVANVQFALRGITPEFCAEAGLRGLERRQTTIIPGALVRVGLCLGKFLPRRTYITIAGAQQKKKLYG